MEAMKSITTKTGDQGSSSLANNERFSKAHLYFETIGTLDELNSWLGLVIVKLGNSFGSERDFLLNLQDKLFVLGAMLAKASKTKLQESDLSNLEKRQEKLQKIMEENWHKKFLLPGGTEQAALIDITRTVARRFERKLVALHEIEAQKDLAIKFVNRISDYLYVLRCFVNYKSDYLEKKFNI